MSLQSTVVSMDTNSEETKAFDDRGFRIVDRLRQSVWIFDIDNARIVWGNQASLQTWQAESLAELQARDMRVGMTETVEKRLRQYQNDFLRDEDIEFKELWTLYPNGEPNTVDVVYSGFRLEDDRMGMMCEAQQEVQLDTEAVRSSEALLHTSVMITLYSASGEPLYRNPAARNCVSNPKERLQNHFAFDTTTSVLNNTTKDEIKTVASVHSKEGQRWHDITARRCHDPISGEGAWLISEVDVSRLKATEERAQFLAEHDLLTGLPNRNYVSIGFQNKIDKIQAKGDVGALIFIDLDRFKDVNDSLGHDAGDLLLKAVADRLSTIQRDGDAVARLGGDEFLLLFGPIEDIGDVEKIACSIQDEISKPISIQGREVRVTPSIGVSMFPENGKNINDLMKHADLAMYHAKENGRDGFAFFSTDLSKAVESRINLESELIVALEKEQFETYFQPRVEIKTNEITGAEALVRWMHPTKGVVSPAMFIPACEASGLIGALGKYVLRQSVAAQRTWSEYGFDIKVSVNLSPIQFAEETLVEDIIQIVEDNGGNPRLIEFEITESVLLGHDKVTVDKLHALVKHGFRIAIDDFGTGYSNLAYLHRYPINCLKIDRSFIIDMDVAQPIVELIVSMARLFNLVVVAEGVETEEQLEVLRGHDCQEYQGFLFEKPVEFSTFSRLLNDCSLKKCA